MSCGTGTQFYRIAEIYERLDRESGAGGAIEVVWSTPRRALPPDPPAPPPPELREAWPSLAPPGKSLRPRGGHAAPKIAKSAGVLFVTLFDLSPERLREAVRLIERNHIDKGGSRPLFLTDNPDTTAIRHAGFTYEYFPRALYGDMRDAALFAERFRWLWRKWKGALLIDFSAAGHLAARLEDLELYVGRESAGATYFNPRKARPAAPRRPTTDIVALRAEYEHAGLDRVPDTFALYRILGNDLPPRHETGQTRANLQFILENEPDFADCEKRWVVNRIVDPAEEAAILDTLEARGQPYLHIPFDLAEYAEAGWDLESFPDDAFFLRGRYKDMTAYDQARAQAHARRHKNNYLINNNGARNAALRDGRGRAKWVLPWDGNCFLTEPAWREIAQAVRARPYMKYFTVPMSRTIDNAELLDPGHRPDLTSEPQILFRRDAAEEFDEAHYYGRRPKVALFYRLGIPGPWDGFHDDVWDLPRPEPSEDAGAAGEAGWVARLFSGHKELEVEMGAGLRSRGEARIAAVTGMLDRLDVAAQSLVRQPGDLVCYDAEAVAALAGAEAGSPARLLHERLVREAGLALQRGPYSVVDKTTLPPGGDRHDYYHPAPYWWPNPATPDGLPYLPRDGERVPGTRLYEPESDRYDRTCLQRMFDDTTALALGWLATGEERYAEHAARLVRCWFLDEATRMNPHLLYSQLRSRTPFDTGAKSGVIEMKDLYYFLDAVRIVERAGGLASAEREAFRDWLREYLDWLQTSDQGMGERLGTNNHGTCYDLQTGSIAAFLGDGALLERTFFTSRERLLEQFTAEGLQPHEMTRTQTAHYCCFNLQCWINLATLAEAFGHDLWSFEAPDGRGLARALAWLLPHMARGDWPYEQIEPFDRGRFLPLFFAARDRLGIAAGPRLVQAAQARPLYFPHDGIKPFWMLSPPPRAFPRTPAWEALAEGLGGLEQAALGLCEATPCAEGMDDPEDLDRMLWAGFSGSARDGLARIRDGAAQGATEADRAEAARRLARWCFTTGDFEGALANAEAMAAPDVIAARERALLRACCLQRTGQAEAAEELAAQWQSRVPTDADVAFLMAGLRREGAAPGDWTGWINRPFRQARLPDLIGPPGPDGDWPSLPAAGEGEPGEDPATPLVSVIVTVSPGAPDGQGGRLALSLRSLRAQRRCRLEILVADLSGDLAIAGILAGQAAEDDRIAVFDLPPGTPEYAALNAALERATGAFVTRHEACGIAHPDRIALQLDALLPGPWLGTVSRRLRMTPEGRILAGWEPDFTLLRAAPASLLTRIETLRDGGGWDAVPGDPDPFVLWRMTRGAGSEALHVVRPELALSLCLEAETHGRPGHLAFPHGRAADLFGRLERHAERAEAEEGRDPAMPIAALPPGPAVAGVHYGIVHVGDLSEGAPALERIRARIEAAVAAEDGAPVGLFHWPDCRLAPEAGLAPALAALVDAGKVAQVSAFDPATAREVVLCHPHLVQDRIDGLPEFRPDRLVVLCGPEFLAMEADHGRRRMMPSPAGIEALFGAPVTWVSL